MPYEQHRSIVWRLVMDLMRARHKSVLNKGRPLGPDIMLLFVLASVAATANKGLPATASKIAFYLEMPRETVRRRLQELVELGLVEREGDSYRQIARLTELQIKHVTKLIRDAAAALAQIGQ